MNDLKILLQFIADGNGTIISSGMAKGILDGIKHLEQENKELKSEVEALKPYKDNHIELLTHMAKNDANVINRFIEEVSDKYGYHIGVNTNWVVNVEDMKECIKQLHQKAQE